MRRCDWLFRRLSLGGATQGWTPFWLGLQRTQCGLSVLWKCSTLSTGLLRGPLSIIPILYR